MRSDDKLTCPCCGGKFTKNEAAWTVCHYHGLIAEPGQDIREMHEERGLGRGPGTNCFMSIRKYTLEDAVEKARKYRRERLHNEDYQNKSQT